MKVYGKCQSCSNEAFYRTDANTRVEFAMKDGERKTINCRNCGTSTDFHVDELYAKHSKMPYLMVGLAALTVIFIALYYLFFSDRGYIVFAFGLPVIFYIVLTKQEQTRVSNFNKRKLKGRTHNI